MLNWPDKDPDEVLDYEIDWAEQMEASEPADEIVSSTWIISGSGLVAGSSSFTETTATVWLSGGILGAAYQCTNRVTTAGGRTYDRTAKLKIKQR